MKQKHDIQHTVACLVLIFSTGLLAQEELGERISTSVGGDLTTQYFFRGLVQEDQGLIFQPYAEWDFDLYSDSTTSIDHFGLMFGLWNSLHDGPSGLQDATGSSSGWYEADLYATLGIGLFDMFDFSLTRIEYLSPNDTFSSAEEIIFEVAFDDTEALGEWAVSPTFLIAFETKGQADGGADKGIYMELGVSREYDLSIGKGYALTFSIPVAIGLSLSDYYEDGSGESDTFGFLDLGVDASLPLHCMKQAWGDWTLSASLHGLFLGESAETANNGDSVELIASLGIHLTF